MAHARVTEGGWYWQGRKRKAGEPIEASAEQIARWRSGGYVEVAGKPVVERTTAPKPEQATAPVPPPEPARDWPHKMSPEKYIHRFPAGPDAELARSLLGENQG